MARIDAVRFAFQPGEQVRVRDDGPGLTATLITRRRILGVPVWRLRIDVFDRDTYRPEVILTPFKRPALMPGMRVSMHTFLARGRTGVLVHSGETLKWGKPVWFIRMDRPIGPWRYTHVAAASLMPVDGTRLEPVADSELRHLGSVLLDRRFTSPRNQMIALGVVVVVTAIVLVLKSLGS